MLSRRSFLRGVIAVGVVASVPAGVLKAVAGPETQRWACDKMTAAYMAFIKRHNKVPTEFRVGKEFLDILHNEFKLNARIMDADTPLYCTARFKGVRVIGDGPGYGIKAIR
jgi:hypothetical protein